MKWLTVIALVLGCSSTQEYRRMKQVWVHSKVNIRQNPSKQSAVVGSLLPTEVYYIEAPAKAWSVVYRAQGVDPQPLFAQKLGYVYSSLLKGQPKNRVFR